MSERLFHCRCCGACCRWPGIVRLNEEAITAIAAFLQLSQEEFRQQYTRLAPDRKCLILTDREDGACVFLNRDNLCRINPVKPTQCRTFPQHWQVEPEFQNTCQGFYSSVAETPARPSGRRCAD
ncbi:MAG: YkgJ family cysteine cluster protein [Oligosphaeraceae bacterium]|nr:YkgJ family cysteine cluster protein [Oligosphaeraceae bacterium]